jgi:inorganic triphosphatase YgiF
LSKLRDPLEPVFETRVTRTSFPVQYGNSEIQLALDEGEIDTGEAKEPICELELELKRGAAGDLFGLAQMLDGKIPLQLSYAAKSGRGYALLDGAVSDLVKARDPDLQPGMSCAEVFRLLAHECLRHLVENRAGVIRGEPDALHQVRIATRRFATVLTLFRDLVPGLGAKAVKRQLHWLRDQTGAARDLDVFLVEVVAPLRQQFPRDKAVGEFYRRLRKRRTEAYRTARGAIRSPEFRRLVVEAAGWIESGDWREEADALMRARQDAPIEIYAAQRLSDLRRKVRKRGKAMRKLNERSRHKLRVHGKKLRYAAEFFMSLAGSKKDRKRARELIDVMQRLQDKLGGLNDIAVRRSLSAEVAGAPSKGRRQNGHDRNFVVGLVAGHQEARAEGLLREAEEAIADFHKVKPFWKDWSTQPALAAVSAAPDGPTAEPEIPASDSQRAAA